MGPCDSVGWVCWWVLFGCGLPVAVLQTTDPVVPQRTGSSARLMSFVSHNPHGRLAISARPILAATGLSIAAARPPYVPSSASRRKTTRCPVFAYPVRCAREARHRRARGELVDGVRLRAARLTARQLPQHRQNPIEQRRDWLAFGARDNAPRAPAKPARSDLDGDEHAGTIQTASERIRSAVIG
jgi:hypothetical protein